MRQIFIPLNFTQYTPCCPKNGDRCASVATDYCDVTLHPMYISGCLSHCALYLFIYLFISKSELHYT